MHSQVQSEFSPDNSLLCRAKLEQTISQETEIFQMATLAMPGSRSSDTRLYQTTTAVSSGHAVQHRWDPLLALSSFWPTSLESNHIPIPKSYFKQLDFKNK